MKEPTRMTATGKTFKWMVQSHDRLNFSAFDEFVVIAEGFRVRLMGETLELSFEAASGPCSLGSAKALAEKYVETLRINLGMPLSLETEADRLKRTTPPLGLMRTISPNREDRSRVARAVREARNELLAPADEALRRCYDHLQDAREHMNTPNDESAHFAVYKAMEVLETHFGSQQRARVVLGNTVKEAKTAANKKRHIPEKVQQQPKASVGAFELATKVIRSYERHLLGEAHKKKEG